MSTVKRDPGVPVLLEPLQIDVCVHFWLNDTLTEQISSRDHNNKQTLNAPK